MKIPNFSFTDRVYEARTKLGFVDVSEHRAAVDAIEAERAEVAAGIERAKAEIGELGRRLTEAKTGTIPDPAALADTLLRGETPVIEGVGELELKRMAIKAGYDYLRDENTRLTFEIAQAQGLMTSPLIDAVFPLVEHLHDDARKAAEALADAYVSVRAVAISTGSGHAASLAETLAVAVAKVADIRLIDRAMRDVPAPVIDCLGAGRAAIEQAGRGIHDRVPVPDARADPALAGLLADIAAAARAA